LISAFLSDSLSLFNIDKQQFLKILCFCVAFYQAAIEKHDFVGIAGDEA